MQPDNKRIAKNSLFLSFRMLLTMCIGLYTSRVVLNTLGVEDYGIYNVVGGIVLMFSFLQNSLGEGVQRFLAYAIGKKDDLEINRIFSMSIVIHIVIAILVLIISETVGLWFLLNKIVVPDGRMVSAMWVYQCSVLAALFSIIRVPYNSLIITQERMSAFAYFSIIEVTLKLLIVYLLCVIEIDKLILYSILVLIVHILIFFCYILYCKHEFLVIRFRMVSNRMSYMPLLTFSCWTLNGVFAMICSTQGINLLLNMFFGPAVNAARGIGVQVQSLVISFCDNFQMATKPQLIKLYAGSQFDEMKKLIIWSSKFAFYLMLMLSFPIIINIGTILKWWLGIVPQYTSVIVAILLISSMLRTLAFSINVSAHATGNIKRFQLWEGSVLLLVLPIAYFLLVFFNVGPIVVMSVYFFIELLAQIIRVWIVLPMISMPYKMYIVKVIFPIFMVSILLLLPIWGYIQLDLEKTVIVVIVSSLMCFVYVCMSVYFVGCDRNEKEILHSYLHTLYKRIRN